MYKVLVIGDWTIDQNWICGIQRSLISSRTGEIHLRGLNEFPGATESLCGAGATASIIYRAEGIDYGILGIGVWHENDSLYLANLIYPADNKSIRHRQPSEQYTRYLPRDKKDEQDSSEIKMILPPDLPKKVNSKTCVGTTRIIRIYKHTTGSNVELLNRIDWETTPPQGEQSWIRNPDNLLNLLEQEKNEIKSIVIKCLDKKVVTDSLIKTLSEDSYYRNLPWYISTKKWKPSWLKHIGAVNCRLFMIPTPAVDMAKRDEDTTKWITSKGIPTEKALEQIINIRKKIMGEESSNKDPMIVVLPSGHRIMAIGHTRKQNNGAQGTEIPVIIQNEKETFRNPLPVETPFASILFGALIAHDLKESEKSGRKETNREVNRECIEKALNYTRKYIKSENNRLTDPENFDPAKHEIKLDTTKFFKSEGNFAWNPDPLTLEQAEKDWENAMKGLGILKAKGEKTIQLFRGATDVDNYICLSFDRSKELQKLLIEMQQFKKLKQKKSCSCMIIAPPGTGKTKLAKSVAKCNDYNFLEFNITQMHSKEHIVDMFDRINTEQAQNPGIPLLVFIDEINAELAGDNVYSPFLAPLEEGWYVRSEKVFHIQPCFWIFAGTEYPTSAKKPNKSEDFVSRLTLPFVNLTMNGTDKVCLEKVYICTSILINTYPDVRYVNEKVLKLFWLLGLIKKGSSIRKLVQFIRSFEDINRGWVKGSNVPINKLKGLFGKDWEENIPREGHNLFVKDKITLDEWQNLVKEGYKIKIES